VIKSITSLSCKNDILIKAEILTSFTTTAKIYIIIELYKCETSSLLQN